MKTRKNKPHPAAEAATSDMLRLTSELEHIQDSLRELEESEKESAETCKEFQLTYAKMQDAHVGLLEMNRRRRRVLHAELENVRELLAKGQGEPNLYKDQYLGSKYTEDKMMPMVSHSGR